MCFSSPRESPPRIDLARAFFGIWPGPLDVLLGMTFYFPTPPDWHLQDIDDPKLSPARRCRVRRKVMKGNKFASVDGANGRPSRRRLRLDRTILRSPTGIQRRSEYIMYSIKASSVMLMIVFRQTNALFSSLTFRDTHDCGRGRVTSLRVGRGFQLRLIDAELYRRLILCNHGSW